MANLDDKRSGSATRFGTNRPGNGPGGVEVQSPTEHDVPSYFAAESTTAAGVKTVYYLWFDSNGVLRRGTVEPGSAGFDQDTSGSAV